MFETDKDTTLQDFYWKYDREIAKYDTTKYPVVVKAQTDALDEEGRQKYGSKHLYEISFTNKGGLVMPIILEWTYKDGTKEVERIPAQVWRKNEKNVIKTFMKDKEVASIKLDPFRETADIDESNNTYGNIKEPGGRAASQPPCGHQLRFAAVPERTHHHRSAEPRHHPIEHGGRGGYPERQAPLRPWS